MRTWDDYKADVKRTDPQAAADLAAVEKLSAALRAVITDKK